MIFIDTAYITCEDRVLNTLGNKLVVKIYHVVWLWIHSYLYKLRTSLHIFNLQLVLYNPVDRPLSLRFHFVHVPRVKLAAEVQETMSLKGRVMLYLQDSHLVLLLLVCLFGFWPLNYFLFKLTRVFLAQGRGGDALGSLDSFVNRLLQYLGAKEVNLKTSH